MGCSSCGGSGLLKSIARVGVAALTGNDVTVGDDVKGTRLLACTHCDQLKRKQPGAVAGDDVAGADKCLQCGCYVKTKAEFATEVCPLGKWGA